MSGSWTAVFTTKPIAPLWTSHCLQCLWCLRRIPVRRVPLHNVHRHDSHAGLLNSDCEYQHALHHNRTIAIESVHHKADDLFPDSIVRLIICGLPACLAAFVPSSRTSLDKTRSAYIVPILMIKYVHHLIVYLIVYFLHVYSLRLHRTPFSVHSMNSM